MYDADAQPNRCRQLRFVLAFASLAALVGCRTTVDSVGYNDIQEAGPRKLYPLSGPSTCPNAFRDVLGHTDQEISEKIDAAFNQLFYGDPSDQAIFFPVGTDEANIQDIYHSNEIRTEGIGYGMIITVELDKRLEFDQLWRYAKSELMVSSGAQRGYFNSYCDMSVDGSIPPERCLDPFGLEQFVMALIFAHDKWEPNGPSFDAGSNDYDAGTLDYEADAWSLFDVMQLKERDNGGIVDDVTNSFDDSTLLVFNEPYTDDSNFTRPSAEMPAYYEMWAQATRDSFWSAAAASARNYWQNVANANTGLMPIRAYFSGQPYSGWDLFGPEGYRTQLNMVLDQIWIGNDSWEVTEANQLVKFFNSLSGPYALSYQLDGTVVDSTPTDSSLTAANGISALIASNATVNRSSFLNAVWNLTTPTGQTRYYAGLMDMMALLVLSGHYCVL